MDAFRKVFNMLMILGKRRDNYRAAELIYNKRYPNHESSI